MSRLGAWHSQATRRGGDNDCAVNVPLRDDRYLDDSDDSSDEGVEEDSNQGGDIPRAADAAATLGNGSASATTTSKVAALNRELKALELRYFRTREQVEKTREQCAKTERDAAKLRNLLDRLQTDKKQLEAQAIANRDYAHKMEQRFFLGTKAQSLLECNLELHAQIQTLRAQMAELRSERDSDRRELEDARGRLALTQRALDLRVEALTPAANGSIHAGVLLELAKLQEQLAAMARQLSDERDALREAEKQQQRALHEARELEERLVEREALVATLERELTAADEKLTRISSDAQTLACEKATLLKFVQQQAEVKFQLDAQLQSVQDDRLRACAALHEKLESAVDAKHAASERVRELEREREAQLLSLRAAEEALREQQDANRELQARVAAMIDAAQQESEQRRVLDEELVAAKDVCRDLQAGLDDAALQIKTLKGDGARLESARSELETQLARKHDEQQALQRAMEAALRDLEALSSQRNQAARAMNEAVTISASSLEEQQALEAAVERQRRQLEQLKTAKSLLQNAMLEQLAALRKQLHAERARRVETEAKLAQMVKFSSTKGKSACLSQPRQAQADGRDSGDSSALPYQPRSESEDARPTLAPRSPPPPPPHSPPALPPSVMRIQSTTTRSPSAAVMTREELDAAVADLAASSVLSLSSSSSSSSMSSMSSSTEDDEVAAREPSQSVGDGCGVAPVRKSVTTIESPAFRLEHESPGEQLSLLELAGEL